MLGLVGVGALFHDKFAVLLREVDGGKVGNGAGLRRHFYLDYL